MNRASGLLFTLCGVLAISPIAGKCSAGQSDETEKNKGTVVTIDGLQSRTPAEWARTRSHRP